MQRLDLKKTRPGLFLLIFISLVLAVWVMMGWPCLLRSVTGIPCPGCGLSRAWLAVLRLDFAAAFQHHPMFWSIPLLAMYLLVDGRLFKWNWLNRGGLAVLLGGMAICYVVRLVGYLSGVLVI